MFKKDMTFWMWEREIPKEVCETIIQRGHKMSGFDAEVGDDGQGRIDHSIRQSHVRFFRADQDNWLYHLLWGYMHRANTGANWNFVVNNQQEPQFTTYTPDFFYDFHEDGSYHENGMRKLSLVVFLSNPSDYTGGKFEFEDGAEPSTDQGSLVVFPSFLKHRVCPVEEGTRYSLVSWFTGPAFV